MRGQKNIKVTFLGQFLTLGNMVTKFFENSNFLYFLGIKSEIDPSYGPYHIQWIQLCQEAFLIGFLRSDLD